MDMRKYANRQGEVQTGAYAIFNIGSRYSTRIDGYDTMTAAPFRRLHGQNGTARQGSAIRTSHWR